MTDTERNAVLEEAARICEERAAKLRVVNSVSAIKAAGADSCAHYIRKAMRHSFPVGCHHPNTCWRHDACMYIGCPHQGVAPEVFRKMVADAIERETR